MQLPGITSTCVGYSGGTSAAPTYQSVGDHTECVQVTYDPSVLSYPQLLDWFFEHHNFRHNNTSYPQYMNGAWYHTPEQQQAIAAKIELTKLSDRSADVATVVAPATLFFRAEEYHQQYLAKQQPDGPAPRCGIGAL